MSAIDDTRKLMQDFVAPDLKAIEARLTALEKQLGYRADGLDKRIDALDKKVDQRMDELGKRLDTRFDSLNQKIDLKHEVMMGQFKSLAEMVEHNLDLDVGWNASSLGSCKLPKTGSSSGLRSRLRVAQASITPE